MKASICLAITLVSMGVIAAPNYQPNIPNGSTQSGTKPGNLGTNYNSVASYLQSHKVLTPWQNNNGHLRVVGTDLYDMKGQPVKIDLSQCIQNGNCEALWEQGKESPLVYLYDSEYDQESYEVDEGVNYCMGASIDKMKDLYVYNDGGRGLELYAEHWNIMRYSSDIEGNNGTEPEKEPRYPDVDTNGWNSNALHNGDEKNMDYNPFENDGLGNCVTKGGLVGFVTKFYEHDGDQVTENKLKKFAGAMWYATELKFSPAGLIIEDLAFNHFAGSLLDESTYESEADPFTAVGYTATFGALKRLSENNVQLTGTNKTYAPYEDLGDWVSSQNEHLVEDIVTVSPNEYDEKDCYNVSSSTGSHITVFSSLVAYPEMGCVFRHPEVTNDKYNNNKTPDEVYIVRGDERNESRRHLELVTTIEAYQLQ